MSSKINLSPGHRGRFSFIFVSRYCPVQPVERFCGFADKAFTLYAAEFLLLFFRKNFDLFVELAIFNGYNPSWFLMRCVADTVNFSTGFTRYFPVFFPAASVCYTNRTKSTSFTL